MQNLLWSIRQPPRLALALALALALLLATVALTTAPMLVSGKPTTQAHREGDYWHTKNGKECTKYKGKTYCGYPG